jgi:hypothetical protein
VRAHAGLQQAEKDGDDGAVISFPTWKHRESPPRRNARIFSAVNLHSGLTVVLGHPSPNVLTGWPFTPRLISGIPYYVLRHHR